MCILVAVHRRVQIFMQITSSIMDWNNVCEVLKAFQFFVFIEDASWSDECRIEKEYSK